MSVGAYTEADELILIDPDTDEAWHLPLVKAPDGASVNVSRLGTYPPKQVVGDWTRSSHEVLSSFVQSDTTGGGQIRDANEATDQGRFWWATADTQYPLQIALPPQAISRGDPTGTQARILGDFGTYGCLVAYDLNLVNYGLTADTAIGTLSSTPVAKGVAFKGTSTSLKFYIPLGLNGFQTWDGTTLTAAVTTAKPVSLIVWDSKLYALQADGQLMESLDGTTWTTKLTLDASYTPRFMVDFYDGQDRPAIHIICKEAVFGVDLSIPKAYRTQLSTPPHPDAGLAGCVWRTDLYVTYGLGVNRYTGSTISATGLDRDHGLPAEYRGAIVDMAAGYNGFYALVRGTASSATPTEAFLTDLSLHDPSWPPTLVQSALMVWNGFGWHNLWTSGGEGSPGNVYVSTSFDSYRLLWSFGPLVYAITLPRTFYNPKERTGIETFGDSGQITYSTLDMDMTGTRKLFAGIEVRTRDTTATETVTVEYQLDGGAWQYLGTITAPGDLNLTTFRLGEHGTFPATTTPRYDAVGADRITIRLTLARGDDATKTPIVESLAVIYQKVMGKLNAYQFTVDCTTDAKPYKGHTGRERQLFLDNLVSARNLIPFQHQGIWRSVRMAGVSGRDRTGIDFGGDRTVSLLEADDFR